MLLSLLENLKVVKIKARKIRIDKGIEIVANIQTGI